MRLLPVLAAALLCAACTKDAPSGTTCLLMGAAEQPATKGPWLGLAQGASYGIIVTRAGILDAYGPRYANIKATCNRDPDNAWRWLYQYPTSSTTIRNVFIDEAVEDSGEGLVPVLADVYAYAPWDGTVSDPSAIPFSTENNVDLMYAEQNAWAASAFSGAGDARFEIYDRTSAAYQTVYHAYSNKALEIDGADKYLYFNFKHTMALLEFQLRAASPGSTLTLTSIEVRRRDGTVPLCGSGVFDATAGTLGDRVPADAIVFPAARLLASGASSSATTVSGTSPTSFYLLLPPFEVGDDDLEFLFSFEGEAPLGHGVYTVKAAHLLHSDGTTPGLQPGCRYTFQFTVENYLRFNGIVIRNWDDAPEDVVEMDPITV